MTVFIDFLLNTFLEGKAYSTVNTYRSAASTTIKSITGQDMGEDHLATVMKGLFISKPHVPRKYYSLARNWSNEKAFYKFYKRRVPEPSMAEMILIQEINFIVMHFCHIASNSA